MLSSILTPIHTDTFYKTEKKNRGMKHYTEITTSLYGPFVFTLFHNTIYCRKRRISRCFTVYVFFYYYNDMGNLASWCSHLRRKHNGICIANSLRYTRNIFLYPYLSLLEDVIRKQLNLLTCINGNEHYFLFFSPYLSKNYIH